MAAGSNLDPADNFVNNPIFSSIDVRIGQILKKCGSISSKEIIEELVLEISQPEIEECKAAVFGFAVTQLNQQYESNGGQVPDGVKLELRKRRTIYNHAHDMIDLVLYVGGMVSVFPKDVLSTPGTYVELVNKKQGAGSKPAPCQKVNKHEPTHVSTESASNTSNVNANRCCCVSLWEDMGHVVAAILKLKGHVLDGATVSADDVNSAFAVITSRGPKPCVNMAPAQPQAGTADKVEQQDQEKSANGEEQPTTTDGPENASAPPEPKPASEQKPASEPKTTAPGDQAKETATSAPAAPPAAQSTSNEKGTTMTPQPQATKKPPVFVGGNPRVVKDMSSESKDTSGKWNVKDSGKKGGGKNNTKLTGGKSKIPLSGRNYKTTDLYVQDITRCENDKFGDIATRVIEHCKEYDVKVTYARIIPKKYCNDTVNCKITVPLDDLDKCLGIRIWPDGVVCRRWRDEPPHRSNNDDQQRQPRNDNKRNHRGRQYGRGQRSRPYYDQYDNDYPPDSWEERDRSSERYYDAYNDRY